jgi:large subunit ribosomal protein L10
VACYPGLTRQRATGRSLGNPAWRDTPRPALSPAPDEVRTRPGNGDENVDRTEKRKFVAGLNATLADTSMIVVTRNQGLTVAEATDLRRRMRAAGATFKVAKNRLTNLALEGTQFDGLKPMLKGPTALAWASDPVAVAKAAVEFARTNEKLVLIGGALGSRTLDATGVRALAELPSLDTLRAKIVGLIVAPATRVAGVLQAPGGQLARVFGALARKHEEGEAAAPAAS